MLAFFNNTLKKITLKLVYPSNGKATDTLTVQLRDWLKCWNSTSHRAEQATECESHLDCRLVIRLNPHLQEEGRVTTGGSRSGGGVRVARLAAELSGTARPTTPRASKPKDLMRSVGKIERDDWNVKEIEKKIMQNRLGRPEPRTAEKVPKWDREQVRLLLSLAAFLCVVSLLLLPITVASD